MKIVLDTNILVSGTFWSGEAFQILQLVELKKAECFTSKEILEEYYRVLESSEIVEKTEEKKLAVKATALKAIELSKIVEPKTKLNEIKEDPDDNKILECALEAKADYIITYDEKHLLRRKEFAGIKIITPKEFLKKINEINHPLFSKRVFFLSSFFFLFSTYSPATVLEGFFRNPLVLKTCFTLFIQ